MLSGRFFRYINAPFKGPSTRCRIFRIRGRGSMGSFTTLTCNTAIDATPGTETINTFPSRGLLCHVVRLERLGTLAQLHLGVNIPVPRCGYFGTRQADNLPKAPHRALSQSPSRVFPARSSQDSVPQPALIKNNSPRQIPTYWFAGASVSEPPQVALQKDQNGKSAGAIGRTLPRTPLRTTRGVLNKADLA